jgi:tRNA modification GTPase
MDNSVAGSTDDIIFAVAAGGARSALSVVRISGRGTGGVLDTLCGKRPGPRVASLRRVRESGGATVDHALVLWFPGPGSYTGEDSAELHLHGGRAVLEAAADALIAAGARPADPGEFTRRAFLNGRMDLVEAEAVGDLVAAETQAQRRQALRQLDGALGRLYRGWAERLTRLMAQQEALIDFPDEDLPEAIDAAMWRDIAVLEAEIRAHLDDGRRGERLRDGLVFAVIGAPNAGKSSLVNALAGRDVAIVAATPGTTRDVLETRVVLGDVPVTLLDTAGLRETDDDVEAEGVRRALARAAEADLTIAVVDVSRDRRTEAPAADIRVANKVDLAPPPAWAAFAVSARTGVGLAELRSALDAHAVALTQRFGAPPLTRARHRAALGSAATNLRDAAAAGLPELAAEEMRSALGQFARLTGRVGIEEILDSVFGQFCIGK